METIKSYRPLEVFCKGSREMELQLGEDSPGFCFGWTVIMQHGCCIDDGNDPI